MDETGTQHASEVDRLVGDVARFGVVASVDHGAARCTVTIGDLVTGPLPWLAGAAGDVSIWSPPTIGEQVLVVCPEGEVAAGLVMAGIFSNSHPAPSAEPTRSVIVFSDGAAIFYDWAAHALSAVLPDGGTLDVVAPGGVTITGNVKITGDVDVEGKIAATVDVIAAGISGKGHRHKDVKTGTDQSGGPV
jgi:phage baseplate assembly protein V